MKKSGLVNLEVSIHWHSPHAVHTDRRFFGRASLWRDFFPDQLAERLAGAAAGDVLGEKLRAGDVLESREDRLVREARARQFRRRLAKEEHGGQSNDVVLELATAGPGMQASLSDRDTDFFGGDPFARLDPRPDTQFYQNPRITRIYQRFFRPGMRVLDLMSSFTSHLSVEQEGVFDAEVTGIGLNQTELEANPALSQRLVHDLNATPTLPLADNLFDAAVCTASIEYLVQPREVLRDVLRTLKPGAPLIVTFSDRWFPTKAIAIWEELHPFERLALVADYFRFAGFKAIGTESIRGLPRPADDPYADRTVFADPVFAVWGCKPAKTD